jgi:mono/diheme cytochrome c family protein
MIREGSPADGGGMPAWEGKLTKQQIDDVIVWIKSLWSDEVYEVWDKEIEHKPEPPRG